jgi:DNA invertase Pin-like site-specific DNA recombinase
MAKLLLCHIDTGTPDARPTIDEMHENTLTTVETFTRGIETWDALAQRKDEQGRHRPNYWERFTAYIKQNKFTIIYAKRLIHLGIGSYSSLLDWLATMRELNILVVVEELITPNDLAGINIILRLRDWNRECIAITQTASIARARQDGKRIGRPPKALDGARMRELQKTGLGSRQIAKMLGISHVTVLRRLAPNSNKGG